VAGPDTRRGEKESERVVARRLRVCGRSQICGSLFFRAELLGRSANLLAPAYITRPRGPDVWMGW
jgi:hypothetical protein